MPKSIPIRFQLSGIACFGFAYLLLLFPLEYILAAFAAAFFHEICHCVFVLVFRGRIQYAQVGFMGIKLQTSNLTAEKALASTLAGPIGSLLLFAFYRWIPMVSIFAVIQGIYNLLPIYPLDGWHILSYLCKIFCSVKEDKILAIAQMLTIFMLCGAALYAWLFLNLGIGPFLCFLLICIRSMERKRT